MLPFLRQIIETGLEAVKAQSKRAGLPNATVTLEGGVVNTGVERKEEELEDNRKEAGLLYMDRGLYML